MSENELDAAREAEFMKAFASQVARNDASCQARGKLQRNYAIGGALEILKGISGPATRVVSTGKAVMPMATGAETFAATK
jgi:hypothetical protein